MPALRDAAAAERCRYACPVARRMTVDVDDQLLDALRRAAAEDGVAEEKVVEDALRRYFGFRGLAVLDEIAESQGDARLSDDEAMAVAVDELRAFRNERRRAQGA